MLTGPNHHATNDFQSGSSQALNAATLVAAATATATATARVVALQERQETISTMNNMNNMNSMNSMNNMNNNMNHMNNMSAVTSMGNMSNMSTQNMHYQQQQVNPLPDPVSRYPSSNRLLLPTCVSFRSSRNTHTRTNRPDTGRRARG